MKDFGALPAVAAPALQRRMRRFQSQQVAKNRRRFARNERLVTRNFGRVRLIRGITLPKKTTLPVSPCLRTARKKTLQIRRVLVPIDFSPLSLVAIDFALPLLKTFRAELHLAHVLPPDYPSSSVSVRLAVPEWEIGRRLRKQSKNAAGEYSAEFRLENVHILRGRPFEQICQLARDAQIDMIITSTRGNTGLRHLTLGSTAERIVRYSPCPVLVLPRQSGKSADRKSPPRRVGFEKIFVPIDFSSCSNKGLQFALALAKRLKSKLALLHAVHLEHYVASDEYARSDFPLLLQQSERVAREQMRELVRKTDWDGVQAETAVEIGHPGQEICERAKDRGVDLIVMSTHGTTGLKHVLLGSVAEYVVRHAHCPVLVVPARPPEFRIQSNKQK